MSPHGRVVMGTSLAVAGLVLGTPTAVAAAGDNPLAGTEWRLVEFQSMSDAIGTLRPEDPSLYTMRLNADGTVNMRLNCNRASGTWTVEPGADPSNGRFLFGPLAVTRALCPPPSMDGQIAAQAEYVRGYMLGEGRLHLSLMADGGIYTWEPMEGVPYETEADPEIEEALREASPAYSRDVVDAGGAKGRYLYSRMDLNGDGREEVFAYTLGSIFCGTGGCNLLLFTPTDEGLALVNDFPITRTPVVVSAEKTEGWSDLFRLESGGGAPASYVHHVFDGRAYVEKERRPAEPTPEGTEVLVGEYTFEDGIPLEPRESAERASPGSRSTESSTSPIDGPKTKR
jgi:heat shock protein HslJ